MPERRHLWRGIHDPTMVRSGLDIVAAGPTIVGEKVDAELTIGNRGIGHAFPTYVTPQVVVEVGQEDRQGRSIPSTVEQHPIGRDVSLDLAMENADTRLMPDEVRRYGYQRRLARGAVAIAYRITVYPDAFYAGFYRAMLEGKYLRKGRGAIREALRQAEESSFVVFQSHRPISRD